MKGYTFILSKGEEIVMQWDLLPAPENVRTEETALTTVIPLPNRSVYRESHGRGIEEITVSGTFGLRLRLHKGEAKTGTDLHKEFRKALWEDYLKTFETGSPLEKRTLRVEFHDWTQDLHRYVEPMKFVSPQGKENKTFLRYEIALKGYGDITRKLVVKKEDKRLVANRVARTLRALTEKLKDADKFLKDKADDTSSFLNREVMTPVRDLTDAIFAFAEARTTEVLFPLRKVGQILTGINSTLTAIGTLTTDPITNAANGLNNIKRQLHRLRRTPELFAQDLERAFANLAAQHYELESASDSDAEKEEKRGGENQRSKQFSSSIGNLTYLSTKTIGVTKGDTLQKLAAKHLGSAEKWQEIAAINNIEWPFLSEDGAEGTIKHGEKILIPSTSAASGAGAVGDFGDDTIAGQDTVAERLYGRDLKLVEEDGKLSVVFGSGNDYDTVAGEDNLLQAILLKTKIARGTLLKDPSYGMRKLKGKRASQADTLLLQHELLSTAQSDPRVEKVDVDVEREGNVTRVSYRIQPISSTSGRAIESIVEDAS